VIAERVEEFLEISGAADQLTIALEIERAVPIVRVSDLPKVILDGVFGATCIGPPQSTRSTRNGGAHSAIGGADAE
jgi:hypothetical protein